MRATKRQTDAVRAYTEDQAHEQVVHLEKPHPSWSAPVRHHIWDVHCMDSRWWVITEPTYLYSQEDFKSKDVVTFHIGLFMRVSYLRDRKVPVRPGSAYLLPGPWRRWEQAFESYDSGDKAENFRAVGVRLRERLVSFVGETASDEMVPGDQEPPRHSDFKAWTELLASTLAGRRVQRAHAVLSQDAGG